MALKLKDKDSTETAMGRTGIHESNILVFTSAKGGSGCSFIANSIASYMAQNTTLNVLLLDMNVGRMDSRIIFKINGPEVMDLGDIRMKSGSMHAGGLKKIVVNLKNSLNLILPPLNIDRASFLDEDSLAILIETLRDHFDLICIDLPEYFLTRVNMEGIDISDRIIFVTLPDLFSAKNSRILMEQISRYRSPHDFLLVVNKYNLKPAISSTGLSNILGGPITTFIPYDRDIEKLVNTRGPGHIFRYSLKICRIISNFAATLFEELRP